MIDSYNTKQITNNDVSPEVQKGSAQKATQAPLIKYHFPRYQKTIEAESYAEALKKLEELIKSNTQE